MSWWLAADDVYTMINRYSSECDIVSSIYKENILDAKQTPPHPTKKKRHWWMDKSLSALSSLCQSALLLPLRTIVATKLTQANACTLVSTNKGCVPVLTAVFVCNLWTETLTRLPAHAKADATTHTKTLKAAQTMWKLIEDKYIFNHILKLLINMKLWTFLLLQTPLLTPNIKWHYKYQLPSSCKTERPENDSSLLEGHSLCTTYPFELFGMAICYDNGCLEGELTGLMEPF